jgi:hypothetical protein
MSNKWLRIVLIGVSAALVLCILLGAGVFVVRWSAGHSTGRPVGLFRQIFRLARGHGAVGSIQSINGQDITLLLADGTTQTILVTAQTRIEENRKRLKLADLKIDERIAVLGSPVDGGSISASLIHVVSATVSPPVQGTPTPAAGIKQALDIN